MRRGQCCSNGLGTVVAASEVGRVEAYQVLGLRAGVAVVEMRATDKGKVLRDS